MIRLFVENYNQTRGMRVVFLRSNNPAYDWFDKFFPNSG
ncbi:hypothetical protein RB2083_983 [Rhodobacteraceae bacterium HTCC2083]|nr:hypothetical protein RB2083_983 [Rhodobacteraceae bacterium HTCC2083]